MGRAARGIAFRTVGLGACLMLAACLDPQRGAAVQDAGRAVAFYEGAVTVAGPRGYCIDPASIKSEAGGSFALLASCEILTGQPGIPVDPAVLTVAVLPRSDAAALPDAAAMAGALGADSLRRAEERDGLTLVQVAQGGETVLPGGDPAHWRASMLINGHIVGLAAYGPRGGRIAGARGREVLGELAAALRAASPSRSARSGA